MCSQIDYVNKELEDCAECSSYITPGQEYYQVGNYKFHTDCINNLSATDILELLKIEVKENV